MIVETTSGQKAATITTATAINMVSSIKLSAVKAKLIAKTGWGEQRVNAAETNYRRFLALCLMFPEAGLVPPADVDEIWHCHILHTRSYAADMNRIFGQYLHHEPADAVNSASAIHGLSRLSAHTLALYETFFGGIDLGEPAEVTCISAPRQIGEQTTCISRPVHEMFSA